MRPYRDYAMRILTLFGPVTEYTSLHCSLPAQATWAFTYCLFMPHVMNLACITMHMTVEEAIVAGTMNAAYSMGMEKSHGSLQLGKRGENLVLVNGSWEHLIYQFGSAPPIHAVIKDSVSMYL